MDVPCSHLFCYRLLAYPFENLPSFSPSDVPETTISCCTSYFIVTGVTVCPVVRVRISGYHSISVIIMSASSSLSQLLNWISAHDGAEWCNCLSVSPQNWDDIHLETYFSSVPQRCLNKDERCVYQEPTDGRRSECGPQIIRTWTEHWKATIRSAEIWGMERDVNVMFVSMSARIFDER